MKKELEEKQIAELYAYCVNMQLSNSKIGEHIEELEQMEWPESMIMPIAMIQEFWFISNLMTEKISEIIRDLITNK